YRDVAFPIGEGQTISQPYTVAYQTELLHVEKGGKILELGTGSGYQACILLELGAEDYTIDRQKNLFDRTILVLRYIGDCTHFFLGGGALGRTEHGLYDKIIVTAGAAVVPEGLLPQHVMGGLLVAPVGDENSQKMITILRVCENEF